MGSNVFYDLVKRNSKPDGFTKTMDGRQAILRQKYGPWPSAKEAFEHARDAAAWEHGNGGYTGTIAEKFDFVTIECPPGQDPHEFAYNLVSAGDPRIRDKWGPAGCIHIPGDEGGWLFFGFASS